MKRELKEIRRLLIKMHNSKESKVKIYATVKKVSRSGMSREASFRIVEIKNNQLLTYNLNYFLEVIAGYKRTKHDTIKLYGVGMDMLFNALDNLHFKVFNSKADRKKYSNYNNTTRYVVIW